MPLLNINYIKSKVIPIIKTLTLDQLNKIDPNQQYTSLDEAYTKINSDLDAYNEFSIFIYWAIQQYNIDNPSNEVPIDLSLDDQVIFVYINIKNKNNSLPMQTAESLGLKRIQPFINKEYIVNKVFSYLKTISLDKLNKLSDENFTSYDDIYSYLNTIVDSIMYNKLIINTIISNYNQKNPSNIVSTDLSLDDQLIFVYIKIFEIAILNVLSGTSPLSSPLSLIFSPNSTIKGVPKIVIQQKKKSHTMLIIGGIILLVIIFFMMKKKKVSSTVPPIISKFGKF